MERTLYTTAFKFCSGPSRW